jgi:uncharacterized protein (TIGR04255 family)
MPTTTIHFSRAPILEAIININVELPSEANSRLSLLGPAVRETYPVTRDIRQVTLTGEMKAGAFPATSASSMQMGFRFEAKAAPQSFQARVNGFSFHRLAPYESWEPFRSEARRMWNHYRAIMKPTGILGCSVRYINRLEVPLGRELSDFLSTYPQIAKGVPQSMTGFLMRADLLLEEFPGGTLVMQEHMIPSEKPGMTGIMLDNDFRVPVGESASDDAVWNLIESLRVVKNRVFVNCLTPEMQRQIA